MSVPTVYIVNLAGHNYTDAEKFGKLTYLTEGNVDTSRFDRTIYLLSKKLRNSQPTDYILPSGKIVLNIMVAMIMHNLHGVVRCLIFNGTTYRTLTIDTHNLDYIIKTLREMPDADSDDAEKL